MWGVPLLAIGAVCAIACVGLIGASFYLVNKNGGWQEAMARPMAENKWPLQRKLMVIGASLGLVAGLLFGICWAIPGGLPWGE